MQANKLSERTVTSKVIFQLKQVCMHKETRELFYLTNGNQLIQSLVKQNLLTFYPNVATFVQDDKAMRPMLRA